MKNTKEAYMRTLAETQGCFDSNRNKITRLQSAWTMSGGSLRRVRSHLH